MFQMQNVWQSEPVRLKYHQIHHQIVFQIQMVIIVHVNVSVAAIVIIIVIVTYSRGDYYYSTSSDSSDPGFFKRREHDTHRHRAKRRHHYSVSESSDSSPGRFVRMNRKRSRSRSGCAMPLKRGRHDKRLTSDCEEIIKSTADVFKPAKRLNRSKSVSQLERSNAIDSESIFGQGTERKGFTKVVTSKSTTSLTYKFNATICAAINIK